MKKMIGELIEFKTKDNLTIHGFLKKSREGNKKLIIHIHGMCGDFFRFPLTWVLSKKIEKTDKDIFLINTRGTGLITRFFKGKKRKLIGTANEKFEESIYDIDAAIKTGKELGYKEFILSGHSTGCQKISYYQEKKKNNKVKALLLLAPGDDYNLAKTKLNKKFKKAVLMAKKMVSKGKGEKQMPEWVTPYSAKRFLSYADTKNIECNLFNYSGELKVFSKIKEPILVVFGTKEPKTDKTPKEMLELLRKKTNSKILITVEIKGAKHSFNGFEEQTSKTIRNFLKLI
ncbi:MAG: DUF1749 domain-containing protein [archaeon]